MSSLVLLEEGVCYDQCIFLTKLLPFALLHSVTDAEAEAPILRPRDVKS